jgi:hypothetical protein
MIDREQVNNALIDTVETTFPEDWNRPGLTVRKIVRLWLAERINDPQGPA